MSVETFISSNCTLAFCGGVQHTECPGMMGIFRHMCDEEDQENEEKGKQAMRITKEQSIRITSVGGSANVRNLM